jgi:uncharacterized membrane protein YccC
MTCQELLERVGALEGEALADDAVRAHLEECEACRAILADLRSIEEEAAALPPPPPPPGAWSRIERRLEAAGSRRAGAPAQRWQHPPLAWLGVAAALVLAVATALWIASGASRWPNGGSGLTGEHIADVGRPTAAAGAPRALEEEVRLAAEDYALAIADLEQVATVEESPLDPALAAALRDNLEVLDQAIDQSRSALEQQPENRVAQSSLFEAFRKKVLLLQDTIALMNEMRKGDEAGAARIIEDLNKS